MIIFFPLQICHLKRGNWCLNLRRRVSKPLQTTLHVPGSPMLAAPTWGQQDAKNEGKENLSPLHAPGLRPNMPSLKDPWANTFGKHQCLYGRLYRCLYLHPHLPLSASRSTTMILRTSTSKF